MSDPDPQKPTDRGAEEAVDAHRVTPNELFLSDFAQLWVETRDTLEDFVNSYLSPASEEKPLSGPEWVEKNVDLAGRMWLLGLKGTDLLARRMTDEAKTKAAAPPPSSAPAAETPPGQV